MQNIFLIFFFAMLGIECLLLIPFSQKYPLLGKREKAIFLYLILSIIFAGGSYLIGFVFAKNNMLFVACMTLLQFLVLSGFYYFALDKQNAKKIVIGLMLLGVIIFILDITIWEGPKQFNSIFASYRSSFLIGCGIALFLQLLRDEDLIERSIYMNSLPIFWFNAGLFVHLCCSFMTSLTFNFLQNSANIESIMAAQRITRILNFVAGTIQLILFYIGLLKIKRVRT